MQISVLIPTYLRPDNIEKCLNALKNQTLPADEIVVVVRDTDTKTQAFLDGYDRGDLPLVVALVTEPGGIAAYNRGLDTVTGEVVAVTDDDTMPHPEWLRRMRAHYDRDPLVGGVRGLDIQPQKDGEPSEVVGRLQWWGRTIGKHHLGIGAAREVDFLKGANCSYRVAPLRAVGFDRRLLGTGAQVHFETIIGLAFRRAGWKLIYDPEVVLDHFPAVRFDYDQRAQYNPLSHYDAVHNGTLAVYEHFSPLNRVVFCLWAFGVGTKTEPALLMALYYLIRNRDCLQTIPPTIAGRVAGIRTAHTTRRPEIPRPGTAATFSAPQALAKAE